MTRPAHYADAPRRRLRRPNSAILDELIRIHELRTRDLAELCRVTQAAAKSWRQRSTSARAIPDAALELLSLKLGEASPFNGSMGRLWAIAGSSRHSRLARAKLPAAR